MFVGQRGGGAEQESKLALFFSCSITKHKWFTLLSCYFWDLQVLKFWLILIDDPCSQVRSFSLAPSASVCTRCNTPRQMTTLLCKLWFIVCKNFDHIMDTAVNGPDKLCMRKKYLEDVTSRGSSSRKDLLDLHHWLNFWLHPTRYTDSYTKTTGDGGVTLKVTYNITIHYYNNITITFMESC